MDHFLRLPTIFFFSQREMLLLVLALSKFSRFLFFLYFLPIWMHFSDALPQIVWYHSTKGVGRVIKTSKILLKCFLDKVVHLLHLHFCGFWFNSEHCPIFHFPPFVRLYVTGVASPFFLIIWWFRPQMPYIFWMHIIWANYPDHLDHLDHLYHLDHLDHPD